VGDYQTCPARTEIENLKDWQGRQNGSLGRMADKMEELCEHEARRSGAEGMLKWIIGVVGFSGIASVVSVIVGLTT